MSRLAAPRTYLNISAERVFASFHRVRTDHVRPLTKRTAQRILHDEITIQIGLVLPRSPLARLKSQQSKKLTMMHPVQVPLAMTSLGMQRGHGSALC